MIPYMPETAALLALTPMPEGQGGSPWLQFVPFLLIFAIFYFLVFAPMRKKQKQHADMLGALRNGDKVVTSGGIHGTVVGLTDHVVQLRIAEKVKIDVSRSAVAAKVDE